MHINFRVDGSENIGFGHLQRCLTLAKFLKKKGFKITFICRKLLGSNFKLIKNNGFNLKIISSFKKIDQSTDALKTSKIIQNKQDFLIVDHYDLGYSWEKRIKKFVSGLMVIDDFINRKHFCDFILNYSFAVKKKKYQKYFNKKTTFLLGSKYAILKKEYKNPKIEILKNSKVKKVFLYFGTDLNNLTSKIVNIFRQKFFKEIKLHVILTSKTKNFKKQKKNILTRPNTKIDYDLPHLANVIKKTQLGIVSGGQIVYECLSMGLPIMIFETAYNQNLSCKYLSNTKSVNFLGSFSKKNKKKYIQKIKLLVAKSKLRKFQSIKSMRLIDGEGTQRIAKVIYNSLKKNEV